MKRMIEINDSLDERVESAADDVKSTLMSWLDEHEDADEAPDISDLDDSGSIHEIIDGSVPVYTGEQRDLWYLYGDEAEELFEDQFGAAAKKEDGWPMGWQAAALYCLIEARVFEEYEENREEWYEEWREKHGR